MYCLLLVFFIMHHHIDAGTYEANSNFANVSNPLIRIRKIIMNYEMFNNDFFYPMFSCQNERNCQADF